MFDYKHYVPIIKWKAAEKGALSKLKLDHKGKITPLIEFIMPQPDVGDQEKTPEQLLNESIKAFQESISGIAENVLKFWGHDALFVDMQLIDGSIRAESLDKVLNLGQQLDLFMVPVISIIPVVGFEADQRTRQVAVDCAHKQKHGLCLRISASNFNEPTLANDIRSFIKENSLNISDVDLLVDFKIVDDSTDVNTLASKIALIPDIEKWRTFIVAGGSFPKDLSHLEKHNQHNVHRADWAVWQKLIKSVKRAPSFSDYTIQYPIYTSQIQASNPSASIRYTLENDWLILRGEGLRNQKGAGFKQYPAQAKILFGQEVFKGDSYSFGDAYIAEKAKDIKTKKTGNPKTWLEAGINHHLSLVADQIANLP